MFATGDTIRLTRSCVQELSLLEPRGILRTQSAYDFTGRVIEIWPNAVLVLDSLGTVFNFRPTDLINEDS